MSEKALRFHTEDSRVRTRFIPVPQPGKWTFETEPIMEWVRHHAEGRVLNACAGETPLTWAESVVSNDIDTDRRAHLHEDVAALPAHLEAESFDTVVFDPPWTLYQANLRYDGHRLRDPTEGTEIDVEALPIEVGEQEQGAGPLGRLLGAPGRPQGGVGRARMSGPRLDDPHWEPVRGGLSVTREHHVGDGEWAGPHIRVSPRYGAGSITLAGEGTEVLASVIGMAIGEWGGKTEFKWR